MKCDVHCSTDPNSRNPNPSPIAGVCLHFPRPGSDSRQGFKKTPGATLGLCQFRQRRAVLTGLGEREELARASESYDLSM